MADPREEVSTGWEIREGDCLDRLGDVLRALPEPEEAA